MYGVLVSNEQQVGAEASSPPKVNRVVSTEGGQTCKEDSSENKSMMTGEAVVTSMEYSRQSSEITDSHQMSVEGNGQMSKQTLNDSLPILTTDSGVGSAGCGSMVDAFNGMSSNGASDSDSKVYKFKNKIHQRFSSVVVDGKVDVSKSGGSSMQEDKEDFKEPLPNSGTDMLSDCISFKNGSTSSNYESSVKSNSSNESASSRSGTTSHSSLSNTVPAFALHPMGVHYIPLVLPVSQVMPFMKNHKSMGICHPVSIPVSFTGPFLMGEPEVDSTSDQSVLFNGEFSFKTKKKISSRSESDAPYLAAKSQHF